MRKPDRMSTERIFSAGVPCAAGLAMLLIVGCATGDRHRADFAHTQAAGPVPWTHERFDSDPDQFSFLLFSDLYGGEREGVFDVALAQMALLRPELILSVGDLIDGGTEDRATLAAEWTRFDERVHDLRAPVFYIGGNHDLTNLTMRDVWKARYGARYYHFVYRDVLFLMLDSEDYTDERMQTIYRVRAAAIEIVASEPERYPDTAYYAMPERRTGAIGEVQAAYFRSVLADHPDVRWTFVLMHKPLWQDEESTTFHSLEAALAERPYTVINGHLHSYSLTQRNGRDYLTLGTTSGGQSADDPMAFDHLTFITMTADGPSIVNLRLDGILDRSGHLPAEGDALCFQASRCNASAW